jgi:bifunctional UDP-N-acetylglucosamine pyrophosphorylase / glucosamine-1-phosphate N-acetyltransferase
MAEDLSVVILAAGTKTRTRSARAKVLDRIAGRPIVAHVLAATHVLDPAEVLIVLDETGDGSRPLPELAGFEWIPPAQAEDRVRSGTVLFIPANLPLLTGADLLELLFQHRKTEVDLTLLVGTEDEAGSAVCCAQSTPQLWEAFRSVHEAGIGGLAVAGRAARKRVGTLAPRDPLTLLAVTTQIELSQADRALRLRVAETLMESGVRIRDPHRTDIDIDVTVAPGAEILPGTHLVGTTAIGEACEIGPDSWIADSSVEAESVVRYSVVEGSRIRAGSIVGPYAHLRPGADVGPRAKIGNFVEVKASRVEEGAKVNHLAYIGDADVGENANVGAGTITCNYDGHRKHRTAIGEGAFIGSNASLVAPVTIGEGAIVAAGSTITEDVPPGALAIGRGRQVNKTQRKEIKEDMEDARAGT